MTTIKQPEPIIPVREQGLANRLQDTGWGRAAAHLLPFYGLIYAATRRTITPALYIFAGSVVIGVGVALANPETPKLQREALSQSLGVFATPFLAKAGINQARREAEEKAK